MQRLAEVIIDGLNGSRKKGAIELRENRHEVEFGGVNKRPPPEKTKLPVRSLEAAMTIRGSGRGRFDKKRSNMISRLKKPRGELAPRDSERS